MLHMGHIAIPFALASVFLGGMHMAWVLILSIMEVTSEGGWMESSSVRKLFQLLVADTIDDIWSYSTKLIIIIVIYTELQTNLIIHSIQYVEL